ncbi:hypothetical protein LQW54_003111 [Pestalotiopsis sp. IQ-011]
MSMLAKLFSCLCNDEGVTTRPNTFSGHPVICHKPKPAQRPNTSIPNSVARSDAMDIISNAIVILRVAEKHGAGLEAQLDDVVKSTGWTEWIAENILAGIETVLREGNEKMGQAMIVAYDEAAKAADEIFNFAKEHPAVAAVLLTIVAVGILVILAPMIVETLGFAELGPIEGT